MSHIMLPMICSIASLALLLIFAASDSSLASKPCNTTSNHIQHFMATKTPYRFVANKDDSPFSYKGCTPKKFWSMIRHGTRNPSGKVIKRMNERLPVLQDAIIKNYQEGKGTLCEEHVQALAKWNPYVAEVDSSRLTHEGEDELLELGERFQKRFPELLPEFYTNSSFKFRSTATQRAQESARYFAIGLFGRKVSRHVWFPDAIYRDPVLRFYKLCERWKKSVDKNPEALSELHKFLQGSEVSAVRERLSEKLGFTNVLIYDDAKLIYLMCSFEVAWHPHTGSPWCSLLSDDDLKVLEYAQDLDYYWIDGYGYEINYKQACPALKDMFSYFRSEEPYNASTAPQAVLYFSHAGTVLKMLAHLGVYQDKETLRADNFGTMLQQRLWRSSQITAFASNIAFVLYKCESDDKILFLHQERPVRLPGCPQSDDLCSVTEFRKGYFSSVEQCDFQNMCSWEQK